MITFRKYIHFLTALFVMATSFVNINANQTITKRSIQHAKNYRQLVRRASHANASMNKVAIAHRTKSVRPMMNANGLFRTYVRSSNKATVSFAGDISAKQTEKNSVAKKKQIVSDQQINMNGTVYTETNGSENNNLNEEKMSQDQVPSQKIQDDQKKDKNTQNNSSHEPIVPTESEENNKPVQNEAVNNKDDQKAFLQALGALSSDKLDQELDKNGLNDEQKKEIKLILANLPDALKGVVNNENDLNNLADKSMKSNGWLEYLRSDILNYAWVKKSCSWARTAWDYTGGALLQKCGIVSESTQKKVTDFCFDGVYIFVEEIVNILGLSTPGETLDKVLIMALNTYFPQEKTWSNMFAQAAFAIAYYGTIRGMPKQAIIWKTMEAFLCTSYCKCFGKDNADFLRISVLQKPINFFYYYIPGWFKNPYIEWFVANTRDFKAFKYITSIIGIANALANVTMSSMQK